MITSARAQIAEERAGSRLDRARPSLVVPIVIIVAVAIVCVVVAVLTAAQRADEVSLRREQNLIEQALAQRGARVLRELDGIAARPNAATAIRTDYDPQWVERSLVTWLQTFFGHDLVVVVDGADQIEYPPAAASDPSAADLPRELASVLALMRGRLGVMPPGVVAGHGRRESPRARPPTWP